MRNRILGTFVSLLAVSGWGGCSAATDADDDVPEKTGQVTNRINGGTEVPDDPIGMLQTHNRVRDSYCTGTMLSDRWLLTAFHCVNDTGKLKGTLVDASQIEARPQYGEYIQAVQLFAYPGADVALVQLGSSVLDAKGQPRATPMFVGRSSDLNGQTVYCQGYGLDAPYGHGGRLRSANLKVSAPVGNGFNVLAGNPNHVPLDGDSGGSCFSFVNGHYQLLGVISTTVIDYSYSHLVGIDRVRDWIEGTVGNAVAIFADPDFKGAWQSLVPSGPLFGTYDKAQLVIGDNKLSSWIVPSTFTASLYRDPRLSGLLVSASGVSGNVDSNVNEQTSSALVSGGVYLYEHGNFQGRKRLLNAAGTYYLTGDLFDEMISSVTVPAGWTVTLFENGPFDVYGNRSPSPGASLTFTEGSYGTISPSFNDRASHAVVREPAAVFVDANYGGGKAQFLPGCYDVKQLGIGETISSVYVPTGMTVQLFENPGLSGSNMMQKTPTSNLGNWNDKASGLCVYAQPTAWCGTLGPGEALQTNAVLWSCDHRFYLKMQNDGNLVLYQSQNGRTTAIWASKTWQSTGRVAVLQNDGNFVLYDATQKALWSSHTNGAAERNVYLRVQDDGNLVVYEGTRALWASNTCCR